MRQQLEDWDYRGEPKETDVLAKPHDFSNQDPDGAAVMEVRGYLAMLSMDEIAPYHPSNQRRLSPILRTMRSTNGSVTLLIESYFNEEAQAIKILQEKRVAMAPDNALGMKIGDEYIHREIVLVGADSGTRYIHNTSRIRGDTLSEGFLDSIVNTNDPIGRLVSHHKIAVYKEMLAYSRRPAGSLGQRLGISENDIVVSRKYRVSSGDTFWMTVDESIPDSL